MELYILRHGETDYNKAGIVQGRGVNSPLNETGLKQAQMFFAAYGHIEFDALFASSLIRSQQTIELFKLKTRQFSIHPELDEISWGKFEGLPPTHEFNRQYLALIQSWSQGNFDAHVDGGESVHEVFTRQKLFISGLISQPFDRVLICTHGRALRIMLAGVLNNDLTMVEQYGHYNTGLYILKYEKDSFSLLMHNDISHLEPRLNYAS